MNTFRIKAYAKINLGLDVLRRRPDGYHEVKMIMQTVDLYDDLEFTKLAEDEIRIFTDKEELPADQGNLIWRAAARDVRARRCRSAAASAATSGGCFTSMKRICASPRSAA